MSTITILKTTAEAVPFKLYGSNLAEPANDFLHDLAVNGRSAYTIRAYALGLTHFLNWVERAKLPLRSMTKQHIGRYIQDFAGTDPSTTAPKQARTVNHRLSVLASFFVYLIDRDRDNRGCPWHGANNPVPGPAAITQQRGGPIGRDPPPRGRRTEFRRRLPRRVPKCLDPAEVERLISAANSWRDKAILRLLYRSGQRIGDWSHVCGRHGVLGLALNDIDVRSRSIVVRLKGARDEHRVPVAEDFWPLYEQYLQIERKGSNLYDAAWIALRRGKGKPLTYAAFEASLRYAARKAGLRVHAHMLRHTMAQMVLDHSGNLKLAQELLGHAHVSTTADVYMHVDYEALVRAVSAVASRKERVLESRPTEESPIRYVFPYDTFTIDELERATRGPTAPSSAASGTQR